MEEQEKVYVLVASNNPGRYALNKADGPDITSGQPLDISLAGQWIPGRVEYAPEMYVNMGLQYLDDTPREPRVIDGYYFTTGQEICGLCVGMAVRLR